MRFLTLLDAFLSKKGQYAEKINPVYPTFVQKGLIFLICYKNHGKEGGYGAISEGFRGRRGLQRAAGASEGCEGDHLYMPYLIFILSSFLIMALPKMKMHKAAVPAWYAS